MKFITNITPTSQYQVFLYHSYHLIVFFVDL